MNTTLLSDRTFLDWVDGEFSYTLFENIDKALPEHKFERYTGGWRSQTYLDGSPHKDKTDNLVVTYARRKYILQQGEKEIDLIGYVCKRDNVDFITAIQTLANAIGLHLPKPARRKNGYRIKNFSLEAFFRICLGCVGVFMGVSIIIKYNSIWGGLLSCALGVMIILGIRNSKSRSR